MKKIAVIGPIGYETAKALYEENREALEERFPKFWLKNFLEAGENKEKLNEIKSLEAEDNSNTKILEMAIDAEKGKRTSFSKTGSAVEILTGGLFGALWEACELEKAEGCADGCEVRIDNVPILQEVVEICELFDVSPYEASSKGSFLIVAEEEQLRTHHLVETRNGESDGKESFKNCGGQLTVIGTMCKNKDRVVIMKDKETKRFLTPPGRQAKDLVNR